jgi:hypothetical protein
VTRRKFAVDVLAKTAMLDSPGPDVAAEVNPKSWKVTPAVKPTSSSA